MLYLLLVAKGVDLSGISISTVNASLSDDLCFKELIRYLLDTDQLNLELLRGLKEFR